MFDLMKMGLEAQAIAARANAEALTDADVKKIDAAGGRVVYKPKPADDVNYRQQSCASAEANHG